MSQVPLTRFVLAGKGVISGESRNKLLQRGHMIVSGLEYKRRGTGCNLRQLELGGQCFIVNYFKAPLFFTVYLGQWRKLLLCCST